MTPSPRNLLVAAAVLIAGGGLCGASALATSSPSGAPTTVASTLPPDDVATPGGLGEASEQSSATPYRLEMFMEASLMGMTIDGDTPLMTGEYAGEQSHMVMDLGVMFADMIPEDQMPPEFRDADLTMEFVVDGTDFYIRAPFFAAMAAQNPDDPSMALFEALGDGWGFVDGTAIPGVDPSAVTGTMGLGGADPAAFFELLANAEGAEQIGTKDVRGASTTGVRADVSLADLMAAQGTTAALPAGSNPFGDATFPIEAWIDEDGFVRQLNFELTGEAIAAAAEASGEEIPSNTFAGMDMSMTMEMFDYGAADITIDIPTEFVDVTEDFAAVMPQGG